MSGPLNGLSVIDVSTVIAGNVTSSTLADFGADVIKVEHPKGGDPVRHMQPVKNNVSLYSKVAGRNKKSVTLNLGTEMGQQLFRELVATADVLIENFRPGTMEKWGLGWRHLSAQCPQLVMLRISGYGQTGPYSARPGFGTVAEAFSGLVHRTGFPESPPVICSMPLADSVTGMYGASSVMFALYERDHRSGLGQFIDLALYEGLFRLMEDQVINFDQLGMNTERIGNRATMSAPRGTFRSKDGKWIALSAFTNVTARRLLAAIGGRELENDDRFQTSASRVANVEALERAIAGWIAGMTREEAIAALIAADVVVGPVCDARDLFEDPQVQARDNIVSVSDPELGTARVPGVVPKLSRTPGEIRHLAVPLGHHNEEIYCGRLGKTSDELKALRAEGVI